jgi:hypothetical protein
MAASADPQQLSPKFTWPLIVGVLVFAGGEALSLVTVEAFNFAGAEWAGVLHKFVTVVAMAAVAYYKLDPLRQNYAQQVEAHYADQDAKLEQASVSEQTAVAAEGKHRAEPVVYDPPAGLIG